MILNEKLLMKMVVRLYCVENADGGGECYKGRLREITHWKLFESLDAENIGMK